MGGPQSDTCIAVEILVEGQIIAPVRIGLELLNVAVLWPTPVGVAREHRDQAVGMLAGDIFDRPRPAVLVGDRQIVAVRLGELTQRLNHQERGREPDRAAPVGVAALDLAVGLAWLVADLVVAEPEGMLEMRP